ncbi:hypothetical protein IHQ71_30515 (plasmid) [Rhizobium sp. TH2]|uniref:hypothetical protein n=1 Tax=Rhizobium sp. TH2 TaxID=2775403 RepID=UPI002158349B|nr:hypothetical protein [Rhizobium sp. TH2]UVC12350.1 hypothetical protein IHQ71_30515 [Rhizobium sp. TH2]
MRSWIGQTKSRSLEMGTVLLISPEDRAETESVPTENDKLCIEVSGEKFQAVIVTASGEMLAVNMMKGPTLFLELPAGHPAHGERSAPGVPTSVWKVTSVR